MACALSCISYLDQQLEFLAVQSQAGASCEDFKDFTSDVHRNLLCSFGKVAALSAPDLTTIIKKLMQSSMPYAERQSIISLINSKRALVPVNQSRTVKAPLQSNLNLHHYLPESLWTLLGTKNNGYQQKLAALCQFCIDLGMTQLNEPSHVHVVATWIMAEYKVLGTEIDPMMAYQRLCDVKGWIRTERSRMLNFRPGCGTISVYPVDPKQLEASHKAIYEYAFRHGEPQKCPVDQVMLASIRQFIPARKTHQTLSGRIGNAGSSRKHNLVVGQALSLPGQALNGGASQGGALNLPGFKLCGGSPVANAISPAFVPKPLPLENLTKSPSFDASPRLAISDKPHDESQISTSTSNTPQEEMHDSMATETEIVKKDANDMLQHFLQMMPGAATKKRPAVSLSSGGPPKKAPRLAKPSQHDLVKLDAKLLVPFPGVPTKPTPPITFKKFTIYTSLPTRKWRVLKTGHKVDVPCYWRRDPHEGWNKVNRLLAGKAA